MELPTALKMADYWVIEPPLSYLTRLYWGFGKREDLNELAGMPGMNATPFHQLPQPLQRLMKESWLRDHPGKDEKDFFKNLEQKRLEQYHEQLQKAREKR